MKRIYIWGGWSRNYGDLAIWDAQTQMLQANSREILQFIPINSDDVPFSDGSSAPVIDDTLVDSINKSGDLLMFGAGGQLMPRSGKGALSGYQVNATMSTLRRLTVPIVVEGFGLNVFPHKDQTLSKRAIDHFSELCDLAEWVSVRDPLTLNWMNSQKIKVNEVIEDPALFCTSYSSAFTATESIKIGLNWAGDRIEERYGNRPVEDIIGLICRGILELVDGDAAVYYFPHVSIYDDIHYDEFKKHLGKQLVHINEVVPGIMPERLSLLPFFVDAYKQMDVVLGTRWHSTIIPHGQCVPCVTYGSTSKNAALRSDRFGVMHTELEAEDITNSLLYMLSMTRTIKSDLPSLHDIRLFSMNQHYKNILSIIK